MGKMSELDGCAKHKELQEYFLRSNRLSALLSVFIGSMLIFDGRLLLNLWVGKRFLSSYTLLVVLAAGYMVALAQQPCGIVIAVRDRLGPVALWTIGEGIVNLALSIYLGRRYGLLGVAMGTTMPMLIGSTLFLPWYALRVLGLSAGDYFRQALAQPIAVGIMFSTLCWFTAPAQVGRTFPYLLWTITWQTACFVFLATIVGLRSFERKALFKHGKVSLGFVRAT
jgi:membrane protein EpsK